MPRKPYQATWWVQLTEGVNYWRAVLPARHLPGVVADATLIQSKRRWSYLRDSATGEKRVRLNDQRGSTAIWMFPGNWTRGVLMREQQLNGHRVLVEVDDLYRIHPPNPEFSDWREKIVDPEMMHKPVSYEAHERIVGGRGKPWIDGLIVSTPQLAKEYADLHDNIYVCPNSVDPDDWPADPPHQQDGIMRIGWAASDSHEIDIPLIHGSFKWAAEQTTFPDVEVVVMGIKVYGAPGYPHRFIDFAPMEQYRRNLEILDVAVCPLLPSRWANCKSDVKALEAVMAGALPIVSREEAYKPWFDSPALVARDGREFTKHIRWCLANPDEVRVLARECREYVLRERTIQGNIWRWREACALDVPVAA